LRTLEEYRELFDFPVRDYYQKLGYDFNVEPFDQVGMEFIHRYNLRHFETGLHDGVHEVLGSLRQAGYSQNILSAREQNELVNETLTLNVHCYFDRIYGLDDHYAHGKTETGMKLLADLKVTPANVLFIGDTRHDAEVAAELGVDCILIPQGHHSEQRLLALGVPLVHSLQSLFALL
jgi:phosphoglycolate phosphatase